MKVYIHQVAGGHDVSTNAVTREEAVSCTSESVVSEAEEMGYAADEFGDSIALVEVKVPREPWAVVVEWQDGTVGLNGPHPDAASAAVNAAAIANDNARNWDFRVFDGDKPGHFTLGDKDVDDPADLDDQIDIYIQEMGTPIHR